MVLGGFWRFLELFECSLDVVWMIFDCFACDQNFCMMIYTFSLGCCWEAFTYLKATKL